MEATKKRVAISIISVFLILVSCNNESSLDEQIVGKWSLDKIYEYENDETLKHNPNGNRYIQFNEDGTYISDGDPHGSNTGRWKVDNEKSVLFIDSEVEDDDSEWNVKFEDGLMIQTGIGHPRQENTKLVLKRTGF